MVITEYNLANNPLLLIYYKKKTGRELTDDARRLVTVNRDITNNKDDNFQNLSDEDLSNMDIGPIIELVLNLFYAMRCAAEFKELNYEKVIGQELKMSDVYNPEFVQELINFAFEDLNLKKE